MALREVVKYYFADFVRKGGNLAPGKFGTLGKSGQFGTTDNLAPRTIWQHSAKVDNLAPKIRLMLKMQFPAARNPK